MHSVAWLIRANTYASQGKVHSSPGSFPLTEKGALHHTLLNRIGVKQSAHIILKAENRSPIIGTMQANSKFGRYVRRRLVHGCGGLNVRTHRRCRNCARGLKTEEAWRLVLRGQVLMRPPSVSLSSVLSSHHEGNSLLHHSSRARGSHVSLDGPPLKWRAKINSSTLVLFSSITVAWK